MLEEMWERYCSGKVKLQHIRADGSWANHHNSLIGYSMSIDLSTSWSSLSFGG
jgi:hypothetical protein